MHPRADMELDLQYTNQRLVELYDTENARGADTEFYLRLATYLDARLILDLGCGTGLLTRELAINGRRVVGVDPAPAMLAFAKRQPEADQVRWAEGYSDALGTPEADLLLMTGNVAQVFLGDDEWYATLRAIHAALRSGGYLAFESRNPDDQAWERWNREETYEQFDSPCGPIDRWLELVDVGSKRVRFEGHYSFTASDEVVVDSSELRFRSLPELTDSLTANEFTVEHVYGDWESGPLVGASRIMVFVARRN